MSYRIKLGSGSHTPSRQRGQSVVEMSVSIAIAVPLLVGGAMIFGGAMDSMSGTAETAKVGADLTTGLDILRADLAMTDVSHFTITEGSKHDSITLQMPVALNAAGVVWGVFQPGGSALGAIDPLTGLLPEYLTDWSIQYRVRGRDLIREYLDASGNVVGRPKIVLHGLPNLQARSGEKSFKVWKASPTHHPNLISISIVMTGKEEAANGNGNGNGRGNGKKQAVYRKHQATVRIGTGG